MNPNSEQAKSIFLRALECESPDIDQFLNVECAGNANLRHEVDILLHGHRQGADLAERAHVACREAITDNDSPMAAMKPGTRIGYYTIREQIGEGGMGVVFVAEQTEPLQRKVALKIIKPGMDTKEVIARFEAERQALAFMEHPNIARVLDAGATESGRSYFVMELVHGIPITDYCDQIKATPRERIELFQTVCDAVQHAHQKGIIHRDIKPSNVLVTQVNAKPVVKVIDFGLAKAVSGQRLTEKTLYTGFMKLMGTPAYMGPEQAGIGGQDIDTRSDIYSLGVLLYELLIGTTPLDKTAIQKHTYDELCRQIREVDAPKPSTRFNTLNDSHRSTVAEQRQVEPRELHQLLDGDLDRVVLKAIEKDRERRYTSPQELCSDLQRFLADEPVLAIPPSQWYIAKKYVRRHRVAVLSAAIILAFLVAATSFSTWQAFRASKANRIAQSKTTIAEQSNQAALVARDAADAARLEALTSRDKVRRILYASNMQLADQLWNSPSGKPGEIQNLLIDWIPTNAEEDLREFAWRYQWTRLHHSAEQSVYAVNDATLSLDDRLIVSDKNGIREWDESSNTFIQRLEKGVLKSAEQFVLSSCGRFAALVPVSKSDNDLITILELATSDVILEVKGNRVLFSRKGDFVFVGRDDSTGETSTSPIRCLSSAFVDGQVWDLREPTPKSLPTNVDSIVNRQGRFRAELSDDGNSFLFWERAALHAVIAGGLHSFDGHSYVHSAAWSPNGQAFAVGRYRGEVYVRLTIDPEKGVAITANSGSGGIVSALAFSGDSSRLAVGGVDGIVDIWDVSELYDHAGPAGHESELPRLAATKMLHSIKAHVSRVDRIAFSTDGSRIATLGKCGTLKQWDLERHSRYERVTTRAADINNNSITFDFATDAVRVKSVNPRLHEVLSGEAPRIGDRLVGVTNATGFHKIEARFGYLEVLGILRGRLDSIVKLHLKSAANGPTRVVELKRSTMRKPNVMDVVFLSDGKSVVVTDYGLGAVGVNISGRITYRYPACGTSVDFAGDIELLAMDHGPYLVLWDHRHEKLLSQWDARVSATPIPYAGWFGTTAISPDATYVAVGTGLRFNGEPRRSDLRVWHVASRNEVTDGPLLKSDRIVSGVAFTSNGELLLALTQDGKLRVWETATWQIINTIDCPFYATSLAISPTGNIIAIGGDDCVAVLNLDPLSIRYMLNDLSAFGLAFSNDGRTLVATGAEKRAVLVDVATGLYLGTLGDHSALATSCDFSPDDSLLATVDFDGNLRFWNAQSLAKIDGSPIAQTALYERGRRLNRVKRYAEAEQTLRHTLKLQRDSLPPGHTDLIATRKELTWTRTQQAKTPPPD